MRYLWFSLLFLLAAPGIVAEQQLVITPETPVTSSLLLQWLHSGDPRLVAWASDFARRRHDDTVIQEMPAWLEHCANMTSIAEGHEPQPEERRAAIAILDTLIQENVQVPIPAIKAVAESFPAQAAILISHLPIDASRATLNDWTMSENENSSDQILARIATMMLAKDPVSMRAQQSSLASRVVTSSEEELYVVVESNPVKQKGGFIEGICGTDLFDSESTPGWPQIFSYDLVENDPVSTTGILLDLNGDSIEFRRFEHLRHGTCGTPEVERLNPWTRHRLLTYWLGVQEDHMLWQPVESFSIIWTNNPSYQQQLGELVETQRERLQATVESLHELGILTESQTTTTPRLVVTIRCNIKPCPLI